ncbi:MAG TPA: hypothetical protein VK174_05180 [Chitinophagales bacterium]|nr:hypothetical protein [Chitinophagales bacterium]
MKLTIVSLFSLALCFKTFPSYGGCNYVLGSLGVSGNCTYNAGNNTWHFNEGDTLLLFYTGNGTGAIYTELYYLNDTVFLGSRLDTIKVFTTGNYKVDIGCGGTEYIDSIKFLSSNFNNSPLLQKKEINALVYYNKLSSTIDLFIESPQYQSFDIAVFDITGKPLLEGSNILPQTRYCLPVQNIGLKIVQITDNKGSVIIKKIMVI